MRILRLIPILIVAGVLLGCGKDGKTSNPQLQSKEGAPEFKSLAPPGSPGGGGKAAGSGAGSQ